MEVYDGDRLVEEEGREAVEYECEFSETPFKVVRGSDCPNHRFGCDFRA